MGRGTGTHNLSSPTARSRLAVRGEPYWVKMNEGEFVGYRRGARMGKWLARHRRPGKATGYVETTLGEADDAAGMEADGKRFLNERQAKAAAADWFNLQDRHAGARVVPEAPYTVGDALDDYLAAFVKRSLASTRTKIEYAIRPALGAIVVNKLTKAQVARWHTARAKSAARLRTSRFADATNERAATTPDAIRRRQSTANRDLTVLKASLNRAFLDRDDIINADAWRNVKPFAQADGVKRRYLNEDETRRLVNAVSPAIRPMVQGALLTGARYQELASLRVRDFNRDASVVMLVDTKSGKPRPLYLEAEGMRLFDQATIGKRGDDLIFPRPDGKRWGASQQARPLAAACKAAGIEPTGFHDLRRTYGARLALAGVPMAVIAEALGHADERITRKHYAHLSPNYVGDIVRQHVAGLGIVAADDGKVTRIGAAATDPRGNDADSPVEMTAAIG